jgi:spore germination protein
VTGAGIPIVLYVALTIVTIMAFNPMGVISLTFPTLTLSKSIEFPVTFLERLESFVAMLWISIAFGSISLFTFSSVRNFVALFNIRNEKFVKLATVIHIPLLTIVALAVKSGLKVIEYYLKLNYVLAALTIVIFPAITIIAAFKKRREGKA